MGAWSSEELALGGVRVAEIDSLRNGLSNSYDELSTTKAQQPDKRNTIVELEDVAVIMWKIKEQKTEAFERV